MKYYNITFSERDAIPERINQMAANLGITQEQLIKRFIVSGLAASSTDTGPAHPGESLEDFFVKNGVWKSGSDGEVSDK